MPAPPPTFTKSKWLAFFAELTAKITHHNPQVVIEGCEVVRRLLTTRISVGTLLEEGSLLQHLLDTLVGTLRDPRPPTSVDVELQFGLVSTLEHVLDLMLALHADGDTYYCLLVMARAGIILDSLTQALQSPQRRHIGVLGRAICVILSMKLGRTQVLEGLSSNINVVRHVQSLEELVARQPVIVKELLEVAKALARASEGATHLVACLIANTAARRLQKMTKVVGSPEIGGKPVLSEADISVEINAAPDMIKPRCEISGGDVRRILDKVASARSHDDLFQALAEVWSLTVAVPELLLDVFSAEIDVKNFSRFLEVAPQTPLDAVLFRSILSWLSFVVHHYAVSNVVVAKLGSVAVVSLTSVMVVDPAWKAGGSPQIYVPRPAASAGSSFNGSSMSNSLAANMSAGMQASPSRPNVCLPALNFMTTLERACEDSIVALWIERGLLGVISECIQSAADVKSILVDSPSVVDGTLSDEVYLQCAIAGTKTPVTAVAVVASKLLAALVETRLELLRDVFASECTAVIHPLVPTLLRIAIHNPTLAAAQENVTASIIHHVPRCTRAARHTSIGECSIVALDALFHLANVLCVAPTSIHEVVRMVPALARATRNSVIPHLRGAVYRVVVRLVTEPAHLVLIAREMPSITQTAVTAVLQYSADAPQWESAAAAEWIAHIIKTASADPRLEESFNFTLTTLPIKLLQLVSTSGISYSTAALLSLITAIFEQQQRLREHETTEKSYSVLAPYGKKSVALWLQLLATATHANQLLRRVCTSVTPVSIPTSDTLARAQSTFEDVSVQMAYSACVSRSLIFLIQSHVSHRDQLDDETVFAFVESVFALPTPTEVQTMVSTRLSISVQLPDQVAQSYGDAVQWTSEFGAVLLCANTSSTREDAAPWLPASLIESASRVLGDDSVEQKSRLGIVHFFNSFLQATVAEAAPAQCMESHAGDLFSNSLSLTDGSVVHGLRGRLVSRFGKANTYAVESGWLSQITLELRHMCDVFTELGEFNTDEMEKLAVCISLCASVLSFSECRGVSDRDGEAMSYALSFFLREKSTRQLVQQGLKSIVRTTEGRRVSLVPSALAGSSTAASAFQRLVALAFHNKTGLPTSGAGSPSGRGGASSSSSIPADVLAALDIAAVCLGQSDDDGFPHAVQKVRALDAIERWVLLLDRQRATIPMSIYRFLSALSLHADSQLQLAQKEQLITVVVETAASCNERGSLALFILRNLCFHGSLKTQMCQDSRFLVVVKSALMLQTQPVNIEFSTSSSSLFPSSPNSNASGNNAAAGHEAYRRQEIATSALWALVHNNQRGKTYVRGLLKQSPPVSLRSAQVVDFLSTPQLREYADLMNRDIDALVALGLQ